MNPTDESVRIVEQMVHGHEPWIKIMRHLKTLPTPQERAAYFDSISSP